FKHCLNQLGLRADQIAFPVIVVPCEMRSTITVKQLISLSPIDRLAFHYQVKADAPDQNGEPIYPSTRFPELTAEFNSRYGPPLRTITS
uniref:hypothetical protein n=1 Tax=Escherichia coli TaxID=562 RepID=UPI001954C5FB